MKPDLSEVNRKQNRNQKRYDALREHRRLPGGEQQDEQMPASGSGEWVNYGEWVDYGKWVDYGEEVDHGEWTEPWQHWGYDSPKEYNDDRWLRHYWGGPEAVFELYKYEKDLEYNNLRNNKQEWNNPTISQEDARWYAELETRTDYPDGQNPWTDKRLKNIEDERRRIRIAQDFHDLHWRATRISKDNYMNLRNEYEEHGLGEIELRWDSTAYLVYLKIDDPNFRVFATPAAATTKRQDPAGFHITLADYWQMHKPIVKKALHAFKNKYFRYGNTMRHTFNNVRVGKNGTIDLNGDNEFEKDLYTMSKLGTMKEGYPHISMD